jgi:hypothetical protein
VHAVSSFLFLLFLKARIRLHGTASGYAGNGNLSTYTDLMDGGWSLTYDHVNRVSTAVATSGVWNNLTLSWTYDSFGNAKPKHPAGRT